MKPYQNIVDVTIGSFHKKKSKKLVSDTIYTFDIETTSLFNYGDRWDVFDYSLDAEYYSTINKIAIPYIWQFSIEDDVYFGREFKDFEKVLLKISDPNLTKIIWIHNLSYEMGFLGSILDKYTITQMTARDIRKPISFLVEELNIIFRCSYMLTNMSLERSAKEYTDIKKLHTLDYDAKVRLPTSTLTDDEYMYCEFDCKCLYKVICYFRQKYKHLCLCPLTSTGEVRREVQKRVDYFYIQKQWDLVPEPYMYLKLMACFSGGYTHANMLNSCRVIKNTKSYDIASSYPFVMVTEKFPCSNFTLIDYEDYIELKDNENQCFMFHVKLYDVKSKYYNNYISFSKMCNLDKSQYEKTMLYDNGRIRKIQYCELWLTDIDLEIITKNYDIKRIDYEEIYVSKTDYLDIRIIQFILECYKGKTALKNIPEKEDMYRQYKAWVNSLYGCAVTNALKNSTIFNSETFEWQKRQFTMDFVQDVLNESKKSYSNLFYYAVGVWVTAYARRNLFMRLIDSHDFDKHTIYCDTDSIKFYGDYDYIFEEYNKSVEEKYKVMCKNFSQLKISDFKPKDKNGKEYPIGYFTYEGTYDEMITLGAKKYCVRENGDLHMTVSGVSKSAVSVLNNDINNFKKGLCFGYKESKKLTHFYMENQPKVTLTDYEGNKWINTYKYGVVLQPTTYTLGITDTYEALVEYFEDDESRCLL